MSARRIGLVGCVKKKRASPAPARDLYVSALFADRRRYVEDSCDEWFVLSAAHGLVAPDTVLEPYDQTLADADVARRRLWSSSVLTALDGRVGDMTGTTFEIHAGASYRDYGMVDGLRLRGAAVEVPAAGLRLGEQLAFYAAHARGPEVAAAATGPPTTPLSPESTRGGRGGYAPLRDLLVGSPGDGVTLGFVEMERLLGRALPVSARRHRAWWANDRSGHFHARSWLDVGWRVATVDVDTGRVTFRRTWATPK